MAKSKFMLGFLIAIGSLVFIAVTFIGIALSGTIAVFKSDLTIESLTYTKQYDGKAADGEDYKITNGELFSGHKLVVEFSLAGSDVGTYSNYFSAKVVNKNGKDVSSSYNIKAVYGTLTITTRTLELVVEDETELYNGKALTATDYRQVGELADGDTLSVTFDGEITEIGKQNASLYASIKNAEGRDVTSNYKISTVDGLLVKKAIPLTISSKDLTKDYDGLELKDNSTEPDKLTGELLDGDKLVYTPTASLIDAGELENEFTYVIEDKDGNDVTHHYSVATDFGMLTVNTSNVRFVSKDHLNIDYTGTAYDLSSETLQYADEVASTDELNISFTTSITNAGKAENKFFVSIVNKDTHKDVTRNYSINAEYGIIQIVPKSIEITTVSAYKTYGDEKWKDPSGALITNLKDIGTLDLLPGHTYTADFVAEPKNAGSYENYCLIRISDAKGQNVTKNYDITMNQGILIITQRVINLKASSAYKKVDGEALTSSQWYLISGETAPGEYLSCHTEGSRTTVGTSENVLKYSIMDSNGVMLSNYAQNYNIIAENGVLTVYDTKEILHLAPADHRASWSEYKADYYIDGVDTPFLPKENDVVGLETVKGLKAECEFETVSGNDLTSPGIMQSKIKEGTLKLTLNGVDVTDQYDIEYGTGILQIYENDIALETGSASKTYDGTALVSTEVTSTSTIKESGEGYVILDVTNYLGAQEDVKIEYIIEGSQTKVGQGLNTLQILAVYVDGDTSTNKREYYKIDITYGKLDVTRATLSVTTETKNSESGKKTVTSDKIENQIIIGLATGDVADIKKAGTLTGEVGSTGVNTVEIYVKDADGNDVTSYYIIEYTYGTLTIVE